MLHKTLLKVFIKAVFYRRAAAKIFRPIIVLPRFSDLKLKTVAFNAMKLYNNDMSEQSEKTNAKNGGYIKYVFLALYIIFAALTVFTSARPGKASENDSSVFTAIISSIKPLKDFGDYYGDFEGLLRKLCGHYALFMITGAAFALTVYFFKNHLPLVIYLTFVSGIVLGGINELIQYFVPLRIGSVTDVILDAHAYFTGGAITTLFIAILSRCEYQKGDFLPAILCVLLTFAIDLFYLFGGTKIKHTNVTLIFGNCLFLVVIMVFLIVTFVKKKKAVSD